MIYLVDIILLININKKKLLLIVNHLLKTYKSY
jgi:hypothetical protein